MNRREFFGVVGASLVVAPTLPSLVASATAPGEHDATRWLQRKIDRLRPGDTLVLPPGRYLISDTLRSDKHDVRITGLDLAMKSPRKDIMVIEGGCDGVGTTDCSWMWV